MRRLGAGRLLAFALALLAGSPAGAGYFIEFNGRDGSTVGHSYIVVGRIGADGRREHQQRLGFFTDAALLVSAAGAEGRIGVMLPEDLRVVPRARFAVRLTAAQHARAMLVIRRWRRNPPTYYLLGTNCNYFVSRVALAIGMRAPDVYTLSPATFVRSLRDMNPGRVSSAPR